MAEKGEATMRFEGTGTDALRLNRSFGRLSTGSEGLDRILGGGLREGRLVEFFGKSNSGKSQIAMQTALFAARAGAKSLYIDTEGSFRPERLEGMAEARGWGGSRHLLDNIGYVRCDSSSVQMEVIRRMRHRDATSGCRLVVVDTLTRTFTVDMPGSANLQTRQAALGVHLSEMARDAIIGSRAYLLTNRVTFGSINDVPIGGQTTEQLVSASVRLEKAGEKLVGTLMGSGESVVARIDRMGVS